MDHNAALHGVDLQDISLHRISLMERNRVMRGMIRCRLPERWAACRFPCVLSGGGDHLKSD